MLLFASIMKTTMEHKTEKGKACVIGLGYVGLTLAVVLAEEGYDVTGVDANATIIERLRAGSPHFHEPELPERMNKLGGKLHFTTEIPESDSSRTYIISVGTNIDDEHKPDYSHVRSASEAIARHLKKGDLVILRSTVTLLATREIVVPILEKSGLTPGTDFFVAFAPERTIEGKALEELRSLPQVVGGLTSECTEKARAFFAPIASEVVVVGTLEEAELIKLMSNAYRDLMFSFSNNLALIASRYNLDINSAIKAANKGYKRNNIPLPSPGVGGYCLTKDPHLLAHGDHHELGALHREGRKVNLKMAAHVAEIIDAYIKKNPDQKNHITILGLAFKGSPATSDVRFSPSHDLVKELTKKGHEKLSAYDPNVPEEIFSAWGVNRLNSLAEVVEKGSVLVFMHLSDHYGDVAMNLPEDGSGILILDTWGMHDKEKLISRGYAYANLGYRSFN